MARSEELFEHRRRETITNGTVYSLPEKYCPFQQRANDKAWARDTMLRHPKQFSEKLGTHERSCSFHTICSDSAEGVEAVGKQRKLQWHGELRIFQFCWYVQSLLEGTLHGIGLGNGKYDQNWKIQHARIRAALRKSDCGLTSCIHTLKRSFR